MPKAAAMQPGNASEEYSPGAGRRTGSSRRPQQRHRRHYGSIGARQPICYRKIDGRRMASYHASRSYHFTPCMTRRPLRRCRQKQDAKSAEVPKLAILFYLQRDFGLIASTRYYATLLADKLFFHLFQYD